MSTNPPIVADNVCNTEMKLITSSLLWTIYNFRYCQERTGEYLQSSTFTAGDDENSKWSLKLYPRGCNLSGVVSLFLQNESNVNHGESVICKIFLLNDQHEVLYCNQFERQKVDVNCPEGLNDFITRKVLFHEIYGAMCGDHLKIFCEIKQISKPVVKSRPCQISLEVPESRLSADLGNLLKNQVASDVVLISSDDHEFPAHKAILAARSSVFAAMFQADMIENARSRVEIADLQHRALQGILQFIYTGEPPSSLGDDAQTLLIAADKYDLDIRLKAMCEKHLISNLTADTAAEVLILADVVGTNQFKERAVSFIKAAVAEVTTTAGWKNLVMNRFDLVLTLFPCYKG